MGSTFGERDEIPVHRVSISSFYICDHEVTQAEYFSIMGNNPSIFRGNNRPVENVSWNDAIEYCNRLSLSKNLTPCYYNGFDCDFTANGYRLPTEAEWEYAATGGGKGLENYFDDSWKFSGSIFIDNVAWYDNNCSRQTHDVKTKDSNELGIYDMTGNVWEWCLDWYGSYVSIPQTNPIGASTGSYRVIRGGSWLYNASNCRVANRNNAKPSYANSDLGFRVVRS